MARGLFRGANFLPFIVLSQAAIVGAQTLPSREQIELPSATDVSSAPQVSVTDGAARTAACPFDASSLTVDLDSVSFVGPAGEPLPAEIAALLDDVAPAGGRRPVGQLCDLRDQAARRLSMAGYVAAVTIPPQEILDTNRSAKLTVILARLVGVNVIGGETAASRSIVARTERLKALYPLRVADIERELLLASDNPGVDVLMTLRRAERPGQVIGDLRVARRPFSVLATVQNYGSKTIGRESATVRVEAYDLTGNADVTFIGGSGTLDFEEQLTVQAGHYMTLGSGLNIGGSITKGWSRPDLGALDYRAESLIAAADLRFPVVRTPSRDVVLGGGFELIDQQAELNAGRSALPVTLDKLRVAYLSASTALRQPLPQGGEAWSAEATVSLRQGLDIFDATQRGQQTPSGYLPSRADGDPTATVLRGGARTQIRLTPGFSLSTSLQGQFASGPLLAFEEFSVGNFTIGRGYDPGATSGDHAVAARVEPGVWIPIQSSKFALQTYAFADAVRIWNEDSFTTENDRSVRSLGVGARVYVPGRLVLDVTYVHPLDPELAQPGAADAPARLLLSLNTQFGPALR